jgi:hypothetical protein
MVASASRSPGPLPVLLRVLQVLTREDQQRKYNNYKPALKRLDTIFAVQSRETPTPPVAELVAQFEEWPLSGAVLKRITEGSKTTFQLQFEWDPASCQPHADRSMSHLKRKRLPNISCSAS